MLPNVLVFVTSLALSQVLCTAIEPPFRFSIPFFAPPINPVTEDDDRNLNTPSDEDANIVNITAELNESVEDNTTTFGSDENVIDVLNEDEKIISKGDAETSTEVTSINGAEITAASYNEFTKDSVDDNSGSIGEVTTRVTMTQLVQTTLPNHQKHGHQPLPQNRDIHIPCNPNQNPCQPYIPCPNSPSFPCHHVTNNCRNPCQQDIPNNSPPCHPPNFNPICQFPCRHIISSECVSPSPSPCNPCSKFPYGSSPAPSCENPCCPCVKPANPCYRPPSSEEGISGFLRSLSRLFNIQIQLDIPLTDECASPRLKLRITEGSQKPGYDEVDFRKRRLLRQ